MLELFCVGLSAGDGTLSGPVLALGPFGAQCPRWDVFGLSDGAGTCSGPVPALGPFGLSAGAGTFSGSVMVLVAGVVVVV